MTISEDQQCTTVSLINVNSVTIDIPLLVTATPEDGTAIGGRVIVRLHTLCTCISFNLKYASCECLKCPTMCRHLARIVNTRVIYSFILLIENHFEVHNFLIQNFY